MRKILSLIMAVLMIATITLAFSSCSTNNIHHVKIQFVGYGEVTLELDGNVAPITVKHFLDLVKSESNSKSYVNRLQPGFVLQGVLGNNTATIKGEFENNGVKNDIAHTKGVISMARSKSYDSASNQFFIMLGTAEYLNKNYAAFGRVTEGFEVIEQIQKALVEKNDFTDNYYYFLNSSSYIEMKLSIID